MRVIRIGDRTSHGGEVITGSKTYTIMGKAVAREHDIVTCPIPGHGSGGILGGDPNWTDDNRAIALEGMSKAPCGADLYSSCSEMERRFEGDGTAGGVNQAYAANQSTVLAQEYDDEEEDSECITTDSPELKNKRLKDYWGTSDPDQIKQIARRMLGIDTAQLPSMAKRRENWGLFRERHFPKPSAQSEFSEPSYSGPQPGSLAFERFEEYAMTDYGALMIGKVLKEAGSMPFLVKVVPGRAKGWNDFIFLPEQFPSEPIYKHGGQKVDPLAVLHHEFEHTRFGRAPNNDGTEDILLEEVFAVKQIENPVRAINGQEPRYTYTQLDGNDDAVITLSVIDPKIRGQGGWTFCKNDPRKLLNESTLKVLPK